MVWQLLVANVLHGLVASVWAFGVQRVARPLPAGTRAALLRLALVLPAAVVLARLLHLPALPEDFRVLRVDLWVAALIHGAPGPRVAVAALLGGTAVLFAVQELWPLWRWRRGRLHAPRRPDPRLDAALAAVRARFAAAKVRLPRQGPETACLETQAPVAAMAGVWRPKLLMSRGMLERLDDAELEAVLAHELAHLAGAGSGGLLLVWAVRALQAANPAALLVFRHLVEIRELACDALAVEVTGRPAALASALLKVHDLAGPGPEGGSLVDRARDEVLRRADNAWTRERIRALLDHTPAPLGPGRLPWLAGTLLGGLLWAIG